jgi:4-amino-4-deoxychorismate lyase
MSDKTSEGFDLSITASSDFCIFTSYLWDSHGDVNHHASHYGNHYFFPYHRDRLVSAAQVFNWTGVVQFLHGFTGLERLSAVVVEHLKSVRKADETKELRKIKICVYQDNRLHVESAAIGPTDLMNSFPVPVGLNCPTSSPRGCIVWLDVEATAKSLFTTHKTSERSSYDRARKTADIVHESPSVAEVLLFNPQNEIMECSVSTPYFLRDGLWVTPALSSGGNSGVTRRVALENGLCVEKVVLVESLHHDEAIWISNGVRGFIQARLSLQRQS